MDRAGLILGIVIGLLLVVFVVVAVFIDRSETRAREEFISECVAEHHPHFECVERWRAGENHNSTTVVPMPVYVGH